MKFLGISDSSVCGGATLMEGGDILASVNEERLDRFKLSTGFPSRAIRSVLATTGTAPDEIAQVLVADRFNYFKPEAEKWQGWLVDYASPSKKIVSQLASHVSRWVGNSTVAQEGYYALKRVMTAGRQAKVREKLVRDFGLRSTIRFIDHHYCHALAAYYTAGCPDATVITLDGGGDGLCSRVYRVRAGEFELLHSLNSYHSIGNYYAYITKLCGFTAHKHEGKITGLAAHGEPVYRELLSRMICYGDGNIRNRGNCYFWTAIEKLRKALPTDFAREDLAASMQSVLEDVVTAYCDYWVRKSGIGEVALVGGVFANVRLNQRVHELDAVKSVFVHPGMGDEGLSFGAAYAPVAEGLVGDRSCAASVVSHVNLGPEYSESEMRRALDAAGLVGGSPGEGMAQRVAEILQDGMVVARFDGRMEYGPRALGNRSILYQPTDPSVNDWLNAKLDRTEFMPFAPVVTQDLASANFHGMAGAEEAARFMTITFECSESMRKQCPGVVHIDGSARPQVITRETNPGYYDILEEYTNLTGIPCLINTSFNGHDEPIVCTPEDAVKGFLSAKLDYLAIGDMLVEHPEGACRRNPEGIMVVTATLNE